MNNPRGSQWNKWDLHVHTTKSFVQEYGGDTDEVWEKFIADLEALPPEIKVIGINDYLFLEGYEKVLTYKNQGRLSNIELLLPVIEFRLREFVGNEKLRRLNYHIIFADEQNLSVDLIKTQFLSNLRGRAKLEAGVAGVTWSGVVTEQTLADLGRSVREATPADKRDQLVGSDLHLGFNNINFELSGIEEILGEKGELNTYLQGKYLKAIGKSEWEDFRWEAGVVDKKTIINGADFVFCASAAVEQAISSKQKLKDQEVNDRLLHCSDAHRFSKDPSAEQERRIGTCFTWIKSDLTFEGLVQTLYEPDRIKIQERDPKDSKSPRILIDHANYKNEAGEEKEVVFNPDLNSIIGVRGNGKSTLLKNIAQAIDPAQFTERDPKSPYPLTDFSVTWGDGQTGGGSEDSPKSMFYIPQGYLSALSYDDGDLTKERDEFLTQLLKKNARFARAIEAFDTFVAENDLKIQSGIQDLTSSSRILKESNDQLKKLGSLKEVSEEITKKTTEMQKYKGTDLSNEDLSRYGLAQRDLDETLKTLDTLNQDKQILTALTAEGVSVFVSESDLSTLSSTRREIIRDGLKKKGQEALAELAAAQLKEIETQISARMASASEHNKVIEGLADKIAKNRAVTDLSKELLDLENTKTVISEATAKRDQARIDHDRAMDLLVSAYSEFKERQTAIYSSIELDGQFKFVNINISTRYDTDDLRDFVDHDINTRDSTAVKSDTDIEVLFSENPAELTPDAVRKIISFLMEGKLKIRVAAGDVATVLSRLLRNRYVIDYPNSVKSSEGDTYFKDMTGGQKAITFLELIFSLSDEKYPILIDQPEDDLDVSGVANDLVKFVMNKKAERQIIIVSHNATLVVCSDGEEVITSAVRRQGVGRYDFEYATGSIENPARRDDIVNILEGGETALQKRMQKLRIK